MRQTFSYLSKNKIKVAQSISNPYAAEAVTYLASAGAIGTSKYVAASAVSDAAHEKAFEDVVDSRAWSAAPYQAAASASGK